MTTPCKTEGCARAAQVAGECKPCRYRHLDNTMRTIGDAKPRLLELISHYGSARLTSQKCGISYNTLVRIRHAAVDDRLKRHVYDRIMNHQPAGEPASKRSEDWHAPVTRTMVAEYARTPEGAAYVERCRYGEAA